MPNSSNLETLRFAPEKELSQRLSKLLYADLLKPLLENAQAKTEIDEWRSILEGSGFRLTPELSPRLYQLCSEVQEILCFKENIEFFVTNNPALNAWSRPRQKEGHSHLIAFNSGLIEKFSDSELKFVIGHELAHIIYQSSYLKKVIHQIYNSSDSKKMPLPISNLIRVWEKFTEISADRLGFVVAPDLESCVTNFFKMSSGLNLDKVDFDISNYLKQVDAVLEKYSKTNLNFEDSHPSVPIRVKAIQLFSESKLYHSYLKDKNNIEQDKVLESEMRKLAELLELKPENEQEHLRLILVATGGLLMAQIDGKLNLDEEQKLLDYLSSFTASPRIFLSCIANELKKPEEMIDLFINTVKSLLEIDTAERFVIFDYLSEIVMADRELSESELVFLVKISVEELGMNITEASQLFLERLKSLPFAPRF